MLFGWTKGKSGEIEIKTFSKAKPKLYIVAL